MSPEKINKMVENLAEVTNSKSYDIYNKKLRHYVNGGYDGLKSIYNNYMRDQNVKYTDIIPFETFIIENDPKEFFLSEVFFDVENHYLTNVGSDIFGLCTLISTSSKDMENKKVEIYSIVKRLELEIAKSAPCTIAENAVLYQAVKKIESYYRVVHKNILEDFSPFLSGMPSSSLTIASTDNIAPKETIAFKVGLLFYTGEIKTYTGLNNDPFEYKGNFYKTGNSLAKDLSTILNEKVTSIKPYLNETYSGRPNDKNVFYSPKLKNEIVNYCHIHQKQLIKR